MANKNTGTQLRWENGGKMFIGSSANPTDEIINIAAQGPTYRERPRTRIPTKDRGSHTQPIVGDMQLQELTFEVFATDDWENLQAALFPSVVAGIPPDIFVTLRYPANLNATTGLEVKLTDGWTEDVEHIPGGENEIDRKRVTMLFACDQIAPTTY